MKFWPKVWGSGNSHPGEQQIAALEWLGAPYVSSVDQDSRTDRGGSVPPATIRLVDHGPTLPAHDHEFGASASTPDPIDFQPQLTHITLTEQRRPILSYEFFVPEPIPLQVWPGGSSAFATQDPASTGGFACVAGSGVRYRLGSSRAVFSEVLTPTDDGPSFETRPVSPLLQDDSDPSGVVRARNFFASWPSWQNQKGPEWVHWPAGDGKSCVTSTRGFGPGLANMAGFLMPAQLPVSGGFLTSYANDSGKDIAVAFYEFGKRVKAGAPSLPPYIDWRRAAVHETGTRKFFVLSDSHGYFHVYPVKDYGEDFRELQPEQIKSYLPPYPAWVTGPTATGSTSRSGTYREAFLWSFNADCTRMVGVPFREQEGRAWLVRQTSPDPHTPVYEAGFTKFYLQNMATLKLLEPGESEAAFTEPEYTPGWWQTPGLVELGLEIEITGAGDMDFTATFTLRDQSYYLDNGYRYYVDAGYLLANRRMGEDAEALLGAPADTLLTAEIELFWEPPAVMGRIGRNPGTGPGTDYEVHPDLPLFDLRASLARAQIHGLRNRALVYYTVRRHDTQEVIRRFRLCGQFGSTPRDLYGNQVKGPINELGYADLRSLTFMFNCFHSTDGTTLDGKVSTHVYAWNELQATATTFAGTDAAALADTQLEAAVPGAPTVQIPGADVDNADVAFYYFQLSSLYLIRLSYFRSFPVHPDGHWASLLALDHDTTGKLDMIQAYRKNGEPQERTSHLAEYNAAFDQERAPDFHTGAGDIAPMATTGLWRIA